MIVLKFCPLCGDRENFETLSLLGRNRERVSNVVCRACGLVFQNPRLLEEEIFHLYRGSDYVQRNYRASIPEIYGAMQGLNEGRLSYLEGRVSGWPYVAALEIGPGAGSFLQALANAGCLVKGIEPDPTAAEFIAECLRLPVINALLGEYLAADPPDRYGLVVALHVLEHSAEPESFLRSLFGLLGSDGVVFLEVPDILRAHTSPEFPWFEIFDVGHIYSYSPATLAFIVERAGGEVLDLTEVRMKGHNEPIRAIIRPRVLSCATPARPVPVPSECQIVKRTILKARGISALRRLPYAAKRSAGRVLRPLARLF